MDSVDSVDAKLAGPDTPCTTVRSRTSPGVLTRRRRYSTSCGCELEECPLLAQRQRRPRGKWTVSYCPRWTHYPNNESLPHARVHTCSLPSSFSHSHTHTVSLASRSNQRQERKKGETDEREVFSLLTRFPACDWRRCQFSPPGWLLFAPFERRNLGQLHRRSATRQLGSRI